MDRDRKKKQKNNQKRTPNLTWALTVVKFGNRSPSKKNSSTTHIFVPFGRNMGVRKEPERTNHTKVNDKRKITSKMLFAFEGPFCLALTSL